MQGGGRVAFVHRAVRITMYGKEPAMRLGNAEVSARECVEAGQTRNLITRTLCTNGEIKQRAELRDN